MEFPESFNLTDEEKSFVINYFIEQCNNTRVLIDCQPFHQLFYTIFYNSKNKHLGASIQCYYAKCILAYPCDIKQAHKMFIEKL